MLSVLVLQPPPLSVKLVQLIVPLPPVLLHAMMVTSSILPPLLPSSVLPVQLLVRLVLLLPVIVQPVLMVGSWPLMPVLLSVLILLPPDVVEPNVVPPRDI